MTQDEQKRLAAEAALEALRPTLGAGVVLGIGTGSTTNCFIDALGPLKDQFDGAVASSVASAKRLEGHGIRVLSLQESGPLALYIDGADEADPNLALIKGGGAALTQEKIVASAAETFYCLVDESKCVETLGAFPAFKGELARFGGIDPNQTALLEAAFTYTVRFGAPPVMDVFGTTHFLMWWAWKPFWTIQADRMAIYKVIGVLSQPPQ